MHAGNGNTTSFCPVSVKTFAMPVPASISRKARSHIMPSLACGMGWDRMWKFTLLGRAQRPWLCEDWCYHKGTSFFGYPQLSISCGLCYFKNKNSYIILCNTHVDFCELLLDSRDYGYARLLCWFSTSLFLPSHWTHLPNGKNGYICQICTWCLLLGQDGSYILKQSSS